MTTNTKFNLLIINISHKPKKPRFIKFELTTSGKHFPTGLIVLYNVRLTVLGFYHH